MAAPACNGAGPSSPQRSSAAEVTEVAWLWPQQRTLTPAPLRSTAALYSASQPTGAAVGDAGDAADILLCVVVCWSAAASRKHEVEVGWVATHTAKMRESNPHAGATQHCHVAAALSRRARKIRACVPAVRANGAVLK